MISSDYCVVLCTHPKNDDARTLAHALVKERLAACVNLTDQFFSVFHWQGKIDDGSEYLLIMKTKVSCFKRLQAYIEAHHPYQVPEIVALPVIMANDAYLQWLDEHTS